MINPEILAPAGGFEQLKAAVRCGADAVYLGAGDFNARRNAENFSEDELFSAVKYCHAYGVKVYVTLNTLIFDSELEALYKTVELIAKSGADAVIVQDAAVAEAVKKICPSLSLHASTQMAVHNLSGALLLEELGFKRVVLSREMSLEEIKAVTSGTSLETEVFVHGAHCMSASGNCYISAIFGERSGNRGKCAQVCRLNFKSREREYALSLKDMSYLDSLPLLKSAGVASFKIEGRMKRPEYVAASVTSTKNALNGLPYDKSSLQSVFSRSGFTDGYLKGKIAADMFGYRKKDDVTAAAPVLKSLEALYKDESPRFPVNATLTLNKNEPSLLTLSSRGFTVTAFGDIPQVPIKAPLTKELAQKSLKKLGGTPYYLNELEFINPDFLTLPLSAINALRRDGIIHLTEAASELKREINFTAPKKAISRTVKEQKIRARFERLSQYSEAFENCEYISLPIDEILKTENNVKKIKAEIIAELPELLYPLEEEAFKEKLKALKALGITNAAVGNLGTLKLAKDLGFTLHGGHRLNITNSRSLSFYSKLGLSSAVVSFELNARLIGALDEEIPRGHIAYGYLPLMLFRACPQKGKNGCGACTGISTLTDRKDVDFTLLCRNKKYSVLLNSVPLYIGEKELNTDFEVLYFTTENKELCEKILDTAIKKAPLRGAKTSGIYFRELL